jgi:hypothetical protein
MDKLQAPELLVGQPDPGVKPKTKREIAVAFVKAHPKKIAAVVAALLSALSPDVKDTIMAILEALLSAN